MATSTYKRKEIPGNILSMTQLSMVWGCSTFLIKRFMEEGLPHKRIGSEYEFNLEECQQWWREGYFESLTPQHKKQIRRKLEGIKV